MEAPIIWCPHTGYWVATPRDFRPRSSLCSYSRMGRKRFNLGLSASYITSPCISFVSIRLKSNRSEAVSGSIFCNFECGYFLVYSAPQVNMLFAPKNRRSCRLAFTFPWALEEQAIGNRIGNDRSNPLDGLSEIAEGKGISNNVYLRSVNNSNLHTCDYKNYSREKEENTEGEELREKQTKRVDVRALAWRLRFATTAADVDEVLKDKGELPLQVYSSMIRGFGREKKLNVAVVLVEWLKRKKKDTQGCVGPNIFIYNSLLGAVKQSKQFDEMEKVIKDMTMEGVHPNIVTYNTLMGIYLQRGDGVEALNLFEEIQKKGLSPSKISYSKALLAYRILEDGFGALKFYLKIRDRCWKNKIGKHVDEDWENEFAKLENFTIQICCQVMRQWLVKNENLSSYVLKLLADMDKAGLETNHTEHECLVWACTREEHCVVVKELYNRIREGGSEITLPVCNRVIWLMGKAKKWWSALEIYEDLLDKGPKPNNMSNELIVSHFNILLTEARRRGIWRWGVRLLNKMEEKGLRPRSREWDAVLVACSKASETSAAVQIFKRMVEQGEKPTTTSYGALLSALEKGRLYDEALKVWKHMTKVGVEPNLYVYTNMASIYAGQKKFDVVGSIIEEMIASEIEPTVVTFNAIISGCARNNNMGSAAYEWFQRMKLLNIMPNEVTYEMLIEALASDDEPRLAFDMYLRARSEGLILSPKAYDAVILSFRTCCATVDVSALGPRPPDKKKKVQIRKDLSRFCKLAGIPRRSKPFDRTEIYTIH